MGQKSRADLKAFFETGDIPTESQFADLIDSSPNIVDNDGAELIFLSTILGPPQILSLNFSPATIIPTPGPNKFLEIHSIIGFLDFNTTAYTGAADTLLITMGNATFRLATDASILKASSLLGARFSFSPNTSGNTQIVLDQPLKISAQSTNPLTGDSDIRIFTAHSPRGF